jgi:AcrR family transcriptional regulator
MRNGRISVVVTCVLSFGTSPRGTIGTECFALLPYQSGTFRSSDNLILVPLTAKGLPSSHSAPGRATSAASGPAPPSDPAPAGRPITSGRQREAALNDRRILEAARTVFLADPRAPINAVAVAANVGISALYRRYPSKEDLLRTICHQGLLRFVAEADQAMTQEDDWTAFRSFVERVVDADVHSLTVHLAGTFKPTPEMYEDALVASARAAALFARGRASGRMRADIVPEDLTFLLEGAAAVRLPSEPRTFELRRRFVALCLDGLMACQGPALPGPPPRADELNWRWHSP